MLAWLLSINYTTSGLQQPVALVRHRLCAAWILVGRLKLVIDVAVNVSFIAPKELGTSWCQDAKSLLSHVCCM